MGTIIERSLNIGPTPMKRLSTALGILSLCLSFKLFAVHTFYCPQNHRYINVGMTPDEVLAACGNPIARHILDTPILQKVPVLQLIYNNAGSQAAFYGVWSIQTGVNGGAQLQVDVVNNKVRNVTINGSSTNAFSICGGSIVQVGDPVSKVYSQCGNPSLVNNTYINQPIESNRKPEKWIYQVDQFQPAYSLTFVNGKLQSIE